MPGDEALSKGVRAPMPGRQALSKGLRRLTAGLEAVCKGLRDLGSGGRSPFERARAPGVEARAPFAKGFLPQGQLTKPFRKGFIARPRAWTPFAKGIGGVGAEAVTLRPTFFASLGPAKALFAGARSAPRALGRPARRAAFLGLSIFLHLRVDFTQQPAVGRRPVAMEGAEPCTNGRSRHARERRMCYAYGGESKTQRVGG